MYCAVNVVDTAFRPVSWTIDAAPIAVFCDGRVIPTLRASLAASTVAPDPVVTKLTKHVRLLESADVVADITISAFPEGPIVTVVVAAVPVLGAA